MSTSHKTVLSIRCKNMNGNNWDILITDTTK